MPKLAVIGEAMLELSDYHRLGAPLTINYGGDTINTAIYYARLGGQVAYITALGNDMFSQKMLEDWQQQGIDTQHVLQVTQALPGLYAIQTNEQGERSFYYWREQAPVKQLLNQLSEQSLIDDLMQYDAIYLTGISLSRWDEAQQQQLWQLLAKFTADKNKEVIFDLNYRTPHWPDKQAAITKIEKMLGYVDIFLPSIEDIKKLWPLSTTAEIVEYFQAFDFKELILKQDKCSVMLVTKEQRHDVANPTVIDHPIDSTAAGDSFNAAYLAAKLQYGFSSLNACYAGHACASQVIQYPGAIIPADATASLYQQLKKGEAACLSHK